jgi:hypothetical protein
MDTVHVCVRTTLDHLHTNLVHDFGHKAVVERDRVADGRRGGVHSNDGAREIHVAVAALRNDAVAKLQQRKEGTTRTPSIVVAAAAVAVMSTSASRKNPTRRHFRGSITSITTTDIITTTTATTMASLTLIHVG